MEEEDPKFNGSNEIGVNGSHLLHEGDTEKPQFEMWFTDLKNKNPCYERFTPEWSQATGKITKSQCRCSECKILVPCRKRGGKTTYINDLLDNHLKKCAGAAEPMLTEATTTIEEDNIPGVSPEHLLLSRWQKWVTKQELTNDVDVLMQENKIFFKCISTECACMKKELWEVTFYEKNSYFYIYNWRKHLQLTEPSIDDRSAGSGTVQDIVKFFEINGLRYRVKPRSPPFIDCKHCHHEDFKCFFNTSTGDLESNLRSHVEGSTHKASIERKKTHSGGLLRFGFTLIAGAQNDLKLSDFAPEDQLSASQCHGFNIDCIPENIRQVYLEVWENSHSFGNNFHAIRGETKFKKKRRGEEGTYDEIEVSSLFRSENCELTATGDKPFSSFCCSQCRRVRNDDNGGDQAIQRLISRRLEGINESVAFGHEFRDWLLIRTHRIAKERKLLMMKEAKFDKHNLKTARWQKHNIEHPNTRQLLEQVCNMERLGCEVKEHGALFRLVLEQLKNEFSLFRTGKKNGYRQSATKDLATAINFTSGGLAASGVAICKLGLEISKSTVQRANAEAISSIPFEDGINFTNIEFAMKLLHEAKVAKGKGHVITNLELSMDESPIIEGYTAQPGPDGNYIVIRGPCGKKGDNHECFTPSISIHNREEFMAMINDYEVSNNLSVIMLNPVNYPDGVDPKDLKPLPIYVLGTCNTFKSKDILKLLRQITLYFCKVLKEHPEYKFNLIGYASDGDKRRVTLQDCIGKVPQSAEAREVSTMYFLDNSAIGYGGRFSPHPKLELQTSEQLVTLMGPKKQEEWIQLLQQEKVVVTLLGIQDLLHVVKKLFNSVESDSRSCCIGGYPIETNIAKSMLSGEVLSGDLEEQMAAAIDGVSFHRKDSMDVANVQRWISLAVQEKLDGDRVKGLKWYINLIWKVRMIFLGVNIPLETRLEWCGFCIESLFGWYNSFVEEGKKNDGSVKNNFITLEAFRDTLIILNYFINLVRLTRDTAPDSRIDFTRCGTNCCEEFFSLLGKWGSLGGQARGELFGDMIRTTKKLYYQILKGNKNVLSRNKLYSYEVSAMLADETKFDPTFITPFHQQKYNLREFDDAKINKLFDDGRNKAKICLKELGLNIDYKISYSSANFKKHCVSEDDVADLLALDDLALHDGEGDEDDPEDANEIARPVVFNDDPPIEEGHLEQEIMDIENEYDVLGRLVGQLPAELFTSPGEEGEDAAAADLNAHTSGSPSTHSNPASASSALSQPKINLHALVSKEDAPPLNVHKALFTLNRFLLGTNRKSRDRDPKIILAHLKATAKEKKGGQIATSNNTAHNTVAVPRFVGNSTFGLLSFILFLCEDKDNRIVLRVGEIVGMTNRTKRAVKWRQKVDRHNIPATLSIKCNWFVPHVPSNNTDKLTSVTTPFFYWDASKVANDNVKEFKATTLVECFDPIVLEEGLFCVPDDVMKYALEFRDLTLKERDVGESAPSKGPTKKRKRTCLEESEAAAERYNAKEFAQARDKLTHAEISEKLAVMVKRNFAATIVKWEEDEKELLYDAVTDVLIEVSTTAKVYKYLVKYESGLHGYVYIEDLYKPSSGKRARTEKKINNV